ncbi:MAG: response regulator, partial [Candidatus Binatia bacterium]
RELISTILDGAGACVETAASGDEAFRLVPATRPDVVVADLAMPGEDGFAFLRRLRAAREWRDVPVIALTALGGAECEHRVAAAGFSGHLTKPMDERELVRAVSAAAGLRARTA